MRNLFPLEEFPDLNKIIISIDKYKILSTLPYAKFDFWNSCVRTIKINPVHNVGTFQNIKMSLQRILRILNEVLSRNYDVVLLNGAEKSDLIYLAIFRFFYWKKTPHIIISAEWSVPSSKLKLLLQKTYFAFVKKLVLEIQAYTYEEIGIYSCTFGIPENKFKRIPSSTTLEGYDFSSSDNGFILAGGSSFRDYETFIEAAKKIPIPVEIGIPPGFLLNLGDVTTQKNNIKIHYGLSRINFMKKTAECKITALPIVPNLKRSVGDQTILNAMFYGKIVIATDSIGPRNYIINGVNGFLVRESDPKSWIEIINLVLQMDKYEIEKITSNALYTAKEVFSEKNRLIRILNSLNQHLVLQRHDPN